MKTKDVIGLLLTSFVRWLWSLILTPIYWLRGLRATLSDKGARRALLFISVLCIVVGCGVLWFLSSITLDVPIGRIGVIDAGKPSCSVYPPGSYLKSPWQRVEFLADPRPITNTMTWGGYVENKGRPTNICVAVRFDWSLEPSALPLLLKHTTLPKLNAEVEKTLSKQFDFHTYRLEFTGELSRDNPVCALLQQALEQGSRQSIGDYLMSIEAPIELKKDYPIHLQVVITKLEEQR